MKIDITIGGKFSPIVMFLYRKFFRFKPLWVKKDLSVYFLNRSKHDLFAI